MIPAHLAAPIDYEAFYSSADTDETQRFKALSVVLERLRLRRGDADWLSGAVHSVHLIDWDWRSESRKYNHRHVPMTIHTSEIFDWYREYGAFIQLAPERAQRFSFARFFFELAPRRDVVVVRFDLTGEQLFAITRSETQRAATDEPADLGVTFAPETVEIRLNRRHAMELCRPLGGLLAPFRERYPAANRPKRGEIISLADTIGNLEEPVSCLTGSINAAKAAGETYVKLPEQPLETLGKNANLLLHGPDALPQEQSSEVTGHDIRVLLANLVVHAYLVPDSLQESYIAIVPGIAQIEDGTPMAAGGFLLHYEPPIPCVQLADWLLLATIWAREKAAFDLVERNRREQFGHYMHSMSNTFGGVIADVRALSPPDEAQGVARQLEDLQSFMLSATALARGETKNEEHVIVPVSDILPQMVEEALSGMASHRDFVNNLFGQRVAPDVALATIRSAVACQDIPEHVASAKVRIWRQVAYGIFVDLLKNALEHTPWSDSADRPVEVNFALDDVGFYVEISNSVSPKAVNRLNQIVIALRRRREPKLLGIGLKDVRNKCLIAELPLPTATILSEGTRIAFTSHLALREPLP